MRSLSVSQVQRLQDGFADRVNFDQRERSMYSHDVGVLPKPIRPLVGSTLPGAVVQPSTEQELIQLLGWAQEQRLPVVPRGKSTSGYGGVLPIKGGLVIDMVRMTAILTL